jgi:hypothetical protein
MAHSKCYGIDEDKCKVPVASLEDLKKLLEPTISKDTSVDKNRTLYLRLEPDVSETIYNNADIPSNVSFSYDSRETSEYIQGTYQTCRFRFNKGVGVGTKPSSFFKVQDQLPLVIKFLNGNLDISGFTRIFLEVFVEPGTIYVKVDGC